MSAMAFYPGDIVFAKIKGFPPWPAKITNLTKNKYEVTLFGSGRTATVKVESLFTYLEHKEKFMVENSMKRCNFRRGIDEVENILNGGGKSGQSDSTDEDDDYKRNKNPCGLENVEDDNSKMSAVATQMPPTSAITRHSIRNFRKFLEDSKPVRPIPVTIKDNLLLVYMPTAKCLGINLHHKKPATFSSPAAEEAWMERSRQEATNLKLKLEAGQVKAKWYRDRIVVEPPRDGIPKAESLIFMDVLLQEVNPLAMESEFIGLSQQLRECLGLRRANLGKCLKVLFKIKIIDYSKLMLLRNPQCVDVIRRLQRYKGNLQLWQMSRQNEIEFNIHAEKIRQLATEIYTSFKKVIIGPKLPRNYFFWNDLCERIKVYREYVERAKSASGP